MYNSQGHFDSLTEYVTINESRGNSVFTFPHIHNHYEIYYNISGAKGYMVNGVFYKCSERDLIIIPKLQAHKVIVENDCEKYERCNIYIDQKLLAVLEIISSSKEALNWLVCEDKLPRKTTLSKEYHEEIMSLLNKYQEKNSREEKLGVLSEILVFLRKRFSETNIAKFMDETDISHTDKIIMIIEKGFHNLTVSEVAELAHYNSDHLNRVFKSEMGVTVKHYLLLRKLAEAQKYLCMGKSVKEACNLSGFNNYSNFLRTFKKYMGYSPGEISNNINRV